MFTYFGNESFAGFYNDTGYSPVFTDEYTDDLLTLFNNDTQLLTAANAVSWITHWHWGHRIEFWFPRWTLGGGIFGIGRRIQCQILATLPSGFTLTTALVPIQSSRTTWGSVTPISCRGHNRHNRAIVFVPHWHEWRRLHKCTMYCVDLCGSGSHRDWTDLYRASNSRVGGALWKALYVQDGIQHVFWFSFFYIFQTCYGIAADPMQCMFDAARMGTVAAAQSAVSHTEEATNLESTMSM
jgi:hypothetical protein